jgi:hypothetical protein
MKRAVVMAVVLVGVLAAPASGVTFVDPEEQAVSHLDIRLSTRNLRPSSTEIRLAITTYDGWRLPYCSQASCSITWELDTAGGRRPDRAALWYAHRRTPICEVYNLRTGGFIGNGTAVKDHHTAACSFPKRWLHRRRDIRWRDMTNAVNDHDVAPNVGFYAGANE